MADNSAYNSKTSLIKKIRLKTRYGLTLQSIRFKLMKIGIEFTPYYLFREGFNIKEPPRITGTEGDYSSGLLKPEDMKEVATIDTAFSEQELIALLTDGEKCLGIKHNGRIVAYSWMNFIKLNYKSTLMHLKSNEVYLWNMFTMESYRGQNLAPYLRYKSYELLKEMGRDMIYSISDYFNTPAVRFKKKLNAEKLKLILFVRLGKARGRSFTLKSWR